MNKTDWLALTFSILAVFITGWIALNTFEGIPHLEDEFAYVWQAQVIARGKLSTPSPDNPKSFLVPFVVDYNGRRFGKYPLGWPVMLSLGERLGLRAWVNPLLAGLGIWLTYRLGKKLLGKGVGLLAAALMLSSPFFLMNSSALLSHAWGLALSAGFALYWLEAVDAPDSARGWLPTLGAALALGVLALSRPLTALGIALPFGIHGLILLWRGPQNIRRRVLLIGLVAGLVGSLHLLWQYAVTGNALTNPYSLWWPYDRLGFGPGVGVTESGHNLNYAWTNTQFSLNAGLSDLFGWGKLSWIFLPFGLWALFRSKPNPLQGTSPLSRGERAGGEGKIWLLVSIFPILVLIYAAYWVGAWLLGPRYYYEALPGLALLSAAGIDWLAGWPRRFSGWGMARPLAVTALVALLVALNALFYIPARIGPMQGLYDIERADLRPFLTAQAQELTPALVIVHPQNWREYAALLELSNPFFNAPFIFVYHRGPRSTGEIIEQFPERRVVHYYPDEPWGFYANEESP